MISGIKGGALIALIGSATAIGTDIAVSQSRFSELVYLARDEPRDQPSSLFPARLHHSCTMWLYDDELTDDLSHVIFVISLRNPVTRAYRDPECRPPPHFPALA